MEWWILLMRCRCCICGRAWVRVWRSVWIWWVQWQCCFLKQILSNLCHNLHDGTSLYLHTSTFDSGFWCWEARNHAQSLDLQVVGYYQASERGDDLTLAPVGERVAETIRQGFPNAVTFVVSFFFLLKGCLLMLRLGWRCEAWFWWTCAAGTYWQLASGNDRLNPLISAVSPPRNVMATNTPLEQRLTTRAVLEFLITVQVANA